ncbi:MAG: signal peptidase I [Patescibacteria group bacterium]|nr:signal peptidase I [Patescibacteria group bacterium]
MINKKLKKIANIFQSILTVALTLVVLLLIFTAFNPVKKFQVLRVMSGSMEPAIKTGSVIISQKINPSILKKDDIITYTSKDNPNISITHRLIEINSQDNKTIYTTKGDANSSQDIAEIKPSQIKGKVIFSLPLLGYLSVWTKKPLGFGLLVVLPAVLIILSEILNIKKTIEKEVEKKYLQVKKNKKKSSKNKLKILIFWLFGISFFQITPTNAYFSDTITISGITISMADDWMVPETTLTVDNGLVVDEKIENSGFETGGSIADWTERGDTERLSSEFESTAKQGTQNAKIGRTTDPGNEIWLNGLGQSISSRAKNLSFWYNFYTYDSYPWDEPGFSAVINGQQVFNLNAFDVDYYQDDLYDTGYYDNEAETYSTGWQQAYIDLTQFEDDSLGISFYAGNTNGMDLDYYSQSWVYLDKVTTTEVVANEFTEFYLSSNEPGATRQYQIQNDGIEINPDDWIYLEETEEFFTINYTSISGKYNIYYRSIDEAGNIETPNLIKVHLDNESPENIIDLEIYSDDDIDDTSVILSWTAPADIIDTNSTRLTSYDIRYWEEFSGVCDINDWDLANKVNKPPVPKFPDESEYFEITGLTPETGYCFAIKTCDASVNCSDLSDIVFATTLEKEPSEEIFSGDVVINELMWMGSTKSTTDEWIELRNTTNQDIDLSNWQITNGGNLGVDLTIPNLSIIPANGYFLISNSNKDDSNINVIPDWVTASLNLDNDGEELILKNTFDEIIDTAWKNQAWPAGINDDNKWSMERNEDPDDGTIASNWHDCEDALTTVEYWDKEAIEQGTPGGKNRSDNELKVNFSLSQDKKSVGFITFNINDWDDLNYEITYDSDQGPQGIIGKIEIKGQNIITRDDLKLAICSSLGKVCVYHQSIETINLKITLTGTNMPDTILEKTLNY